MAEFSWFWEGDSVGDCGPYTEDQLARMLSNISQIDRTKTGILHKDNEFLPVFVYPFTIKISNGKAIVDGIYYSSSSNMLFTVSKPSSGYYYYTVILRKDWITQTIRMSMLGPSPVSYPAISQNDGVAWENSICFIMVDNLGTVTLTDVRNFCQLSTEITNSMIHVLSIASSQIADSSMGTAKFQNGSVTAVKMSNIVYPLGNFGDIAVASGAASLWSFPFPALIAANTGKVITADSIAPLGLRWLSFFDRAIYKRQGGDPDDWTIGGDSNYDVKNPIFIVGRMKLQCSPGSTDANGGSEHNFSPVFSKPPILMVQDPIIRYPTTGHQIKYLTVNTPSVSGFTASAVLWNASTDNTILYYTFIAVGEQ